MKEIFGEELLSKMKRYKDAVMRTETPDIVKNTSGTSYNFHTLLRDFTKRTGMVLTFGGQPLGGAALFLAARIPQLFGGKAAQKLISDLPKVPPQTIMPATMGAALGTEATRAPSLEELSR
jgi:hypothetical protein